MLAFHRTTTSLELGETDVCHARDPNELLEVLITSREMRLVGRCRISTVGRKVTAKQQQNRILRYCSGRTSVLSCRQFKPRANCTGWSWQRADKAVLKPGPPAVIGRVSSAVIDNRASASAPGKDWGKRIEWTWAGGDYFLAVVVEEEDRVIAEYWGTRKEVLAWMETHWPQIPTKFVPMVYSPDRRHRKSANEEPMPPRRSAREVPPSPHHVN